MVVGKFGACLESHSRRLHSNRLQPVRLNIFLRTISPIRPHRSCAQCHQPMSLVAPPKARITIQMSLVRFN